MQILDNPVQRVKKNFKNIFGKTVMKRARTTTTKQNTNQELFFNPLQIFLLTFIFRCGSLVRNGDSLTYPPTYLHNSKMIFLARPDFSLHVLKMIFLSGDEIFWGICADPYRYLHKLKMKKAALP